MHAHPASLKTHRMQSTVESSVVDGEVGFSWVKFAWLGGMATAAIVGGAFTFSRAALGVFLLSTGVVLLFGHSLGSHRKLIHNSFQCPQWLEYTLVYLGVQVGLAGPLGLLRQHELRDFAQRLEVCHDYLRHGRSFWQDAWWQLFCDLRLLRPPSIDIEPRIAQNRFLVWLERTWMLQQVPPALLLYWAGGWSFVYWGVCARVTAGVFGHWLIGYFAHNHGAMNYEVHHAAVQGRNIRWTSLLTMGESWHNNHHAYPGSAKLGLFAGEWDPGWWALMVFRKLGWVWGIRLPKDLPARAELHACSSLAKNAVAKPGFAIVREPVPVALGGLYRLCLSVRSLQQDTRYRMAGPAAAVSEKVLRAVVGKEIPFTRDNSLRRLSLSWDCIVVYGLPALCVALCARPFGLKVIGLVLLPFAVAYEKLRSGFGLPAA